MRLVEINLEGEDKFITIDPGRGHQLLHLREGDEFFDHDDWLNFTASQAKKESMTEETP